MLTKEGLQFVLRLTDYFGGHWEDPSWGRRAVNQTLLLTSIGTLVEGVADEEARRALQTAVARATVGAARGVGVAA